MPRGIPRRDRRRQLVSNEPLEQQRAIERDIEGCLCPLDTDQLIPRPPVRRDDPQQHLRVRPHEQLMHLLTIRLQRVQGTLIHHVRRATGHVTRQIRPCHAPQFANRQQMPGVLHEQGGAGVQRHVRHPLVRPRARGIGDQRRGGRRVGHGLDTLWGWQHADEMRSTEDSPETTATQHDPVPVLRSAPA